MPRRSGLALCGFLHRAVERPVVPGVQGVSWVKYLRRIEVGDKPWNTKDETVHDVDLMPDGTHRQYTSIQECKSVVTTPSGGQMLLDRGFYAITGLAWSGRGKVKAVDVSVDGGCNWRAARLQEPVMSNFGVPDGIAALLHKNNCVSCHAPNQRIVGPAWLMWRNSSSGRFKRVRT